MPKPRNPGVISWAAVIALASIINCTSGNARTVQSWTALRDHEVVKQTTDWSCGAAALSTLLSNYYQEHISETEILNDFSEGERMSFRSMSKFLRRRNFDVHAYHLSFDQLAASRIPAIVHLRRGILAHFSVMRGVDANHVWLADPTLGNRIYTREQFIELWGDPESKGKALYILTKNRHSFRRNFFNKKSVRNTHRFDNHNVF